MKALFFAAALLAFYAFKPADMLTGKWQSQPSAKGNVTLVNFKSDNSFDGFINKKPFVTGNYRLHDSIFTFTDNGCNGFEGVYQVVLFSNADSMRFIPVADSCTERRNGMQKLVLGRIKQL